MKGSGGPGSGVPGSASSVLMRRTLRAAHPRSGVQGSRRDRGAQHRRSGGARRRQARAGPHGYFAGGAGDERTLRRNVEAYADWELWPRVLVDVSEIDTEAEVLGAPISMPVLSPRSPSRSSPTPKARRRWPAPPTRPAPRCASPPSRPRARPRSPRPRRAAQVDAALLLPRPRRHPGAARRGGRPRPRGGAADGRRPLRGQPGARLPDRLRGPGRDARARDRRRRRPTT